MRKLSHWLEEMLPAESIDFYREMALSHALEGGSRGAEIAQFIRKDDLRALCDYEINYAEPWDIAQLRSCRQALAYFTKVEDLEIGVDKKQVALDKFLAAEAACSETNRVFRLLHEGRLQAPPRVAAVLFSAQRKIARTLGDLPRLDELKFRFGPGATRGVRKKDASIRAKIAEKVSCSKELFPLAALMLGEMPHLAELHSSMDRIDEDGVEWSLVDVEIQTSKLAYAKKNAKTYRCTCTESSLNVLYQLAFGEVIASRLLRVGPDISDQTLNQRRAQRGSISGEEATLDLVSASDMLSYELVGSLLPLDWFIALCRGRSGEVELPSGKIIRQEKFSSMGNGFTFPLETLIFWSLAASCCDSEADATVYGDDIVVPVSAYDLLTEVLSFCGFQVNHKKSFKSTPFRESCGKDYFNGIDVRPVYQSGWVSAQSLFVLHNWYVRHEDTERASRVESFIHPALRIYGPDEYGDGHLIGSHEPVRPEKYHQRGYGGYFFSTFTVRARRDVRPLKGDFVSSLYTVYRRQDGGIETLHRGSQGLNMKWMIDYTSDRTLFSLLEEVPLAIPENPDGTKAYTLPGVDGYKKISIYTLRA